MGPVSDPAFLLLVLEPIGFTVAKVGMAQGTVPYFRAGVRGANLNDDRPGAF